MSLSAGVATLILSYVLVTELAKQIRDMWYSSKRQEKKNPASLKESAEKIINSNLGHIADSITSRFSCGGKLSLKGTVSLAYKTAIPGEEDARHCTSTRKAAEVTWHTVKFPGEDQMAVCKLLGACTVYDTSVEYKGEGMTGKNYHRLAPKDFMTTFQLCNTSILRKIGLNNPTCVSLQAELYELTIYAPGGFLKYHVNVSQSEHTFGSLVVCLPTQFSGGELVIRHQKK